MPNTTAALEIERRSTIKPRTAIIAGIVAALAIIGAFAGYAMLSASAANTGLLAAATTTTTSSSASSSNSSQTAVGPCAGYGASGSGGFRGGQGPVGIGPMGFNQQNEVNLTTGQTITLTSTSGEYYVLGSSSNTNGTASGTFTFTVTGKLSTGYVLTLSSGSITVDGQTYTVSSGTAQMSRSADSISGQGTTSSSGAFTIQAQAHGSFVGSSATVSIDFSNSSSEYAIYLQGSA